jgi:type I restriction enzyme S subunit
MCFNQGCRGLVPTKKILTRFGYWALLSAIPDLQSAGQGTTFQELGRDKLRSIKIPTPDLATQRQIADFLDRETARIDLLIEKKQKLVKLLGENRDAFIESVVTNGFTFRPSRNQNLRDDGWKLAKLKNLSSRLKVGVVVNPSDYIDDDGEIPFIYGGNIREYSIDVANCRRMSAESSRRLRASRLKPGDVVVVRVGAPGVAAVIPDSIAEANCASIMCVTPKSCSGEWLAYAFNTRFVRHQVEVVQYGAAQKQFNLEHAREFTIPMPPLSEEANLIDRMHAFTERNAKIKNTTLHSIDRLKEYRSALITAAVTGQIDVQAYGKSGATDRRLDAIEEEMGA